MITALLKIVGANKKDDYHKSGDMERVIIYILDKNSRDQAGDNIYGRIGSVSKKTEDIIKDFNRTKEIYDKKDGLQIKHIVITFEKRPEIKTKKMRKLVRKTCRYFGSEYQLVYAVHENQPENYHIHIGINSVSNYGKKFSFRYEDIERFKKYFNRIWNQYEVTMTNGWNQKDW